MILDDIPLMSLLTDPRRLSQCIPQAVSCMSMFLFLYLYTIQVEWLETDSLGCQPQIISIEIIFACSQNDQMGVLLR